MTQLYDALFESLANEHRRKILFDLADRDTKNESPICLDAPPDTVDDPTTVRIELYHVHLPQLDDHGFIDWEPRTNAVKAGDRFSDIRPFLEFFRDQRAEAPFETV